MAQTLAGQQYHIRLKEEKGLRRSYVGKVTGLSRAQVTRLIGQYLDQGTIEEKGYNRNRFARRYTRADIGLLAATLNVWLEPSFPAVFTVDQSGSGGAAALNATNNQIVSSSNPLHGGEYLELFLTGLGSTMSQGGFAVARQLPTVSVGGADCPVTYAGAAPGFPRLDQINCRVPSGLGTQAAAKVVVQSGARASQTTTVAVQ